MPFLTISSLLLASLLSPDEAFNPQRTAERTAPLASSWNDPLDILKVELVNPFATAGIGRGPLLVGRDLPSKTTVSQEAWIAVDVDVEGNGTRIRRLIVPACEPAVERCEIFEQIVRQVSRWSWTPAKGTGGAVATRAIAAIRLDWEIESLSVAKVSYGPIEPDQLPPPVKIPALRLETFIEEMTARGATTDLPAGMVPAESLSQIAAPPSKSVDISTRSLTVAGDLLVHVTSTGTVDRVLPLDVRPPLLWPVWKKAISAWKFQPAKVGDTATDVWIRLELKDAKAEISAESTGVASVKKSVPLPPSPSSPGRP